jgi:hypothetical protein
MATAVFAETLEKPSTFDAAYSETIHQGQDVIHNLNIRRDAGIIILKVAVQLTEYMCNTQRRFFLEQTPAVSIQSLRD